MPQQQQQPRPRPPPPHGPPIAGCYRRSPSLASRSRRRRQMGPSAQRALLSHHRRSARRPGSAVVASSVRPLDPVLKGSTTSAVCSTVKPLTATDILHVPDKGSDVQPTSPPVTRSWWSLDCRQKSQHVPDTGKKDDTTSSFVEADPSGLHATRQHL